MPNLLQEPIVTELPVFKRLSNAMIYPDKSFSVRIETSAGAADVRITPSELGEIINYLIAAAIHAAQDNEPTAERMPPALPQSPIALQGLGLAHGRNSAETLLWVYLTPSLALPFALDSKKLTELEHGLSNTLKTMAANPNNMN